MKRPGFHTGPSTSDDLPSHISHTGYALFTEYRSADENHVSNAASNAESAIAQSILVVDDDPVILEYVRLHLSTADFDVRVAPSVAAAIAAISNRCQKY